MKFPFAVLCVSLAGLVTACSNSPQNQARVRKDTARTTSTIKNDLQAVGQGIRDGLHDKTPAASDRVDINTAGRSDLESLPGINGTLADSIIAHRPYRDSADLTRKHVLTAAEYDRVAPRVTTSH